MAQIHFSISPSRSYGTSLSPFPRHRIMQCVSHQAVDFYKPWTHCVVNGGATSGLGFSGPVFLVELRITLVPSSSRLPLYLCGCQHVIGRPRQGSLGSWFQGRAGSRFSLIHAVMLPAWEMCIVRRLKRDQKLFGWNYNIAPKKVRGKVCFLFSPLQTCSL